MGKEKSQAWIKERLDDANEARKKQLKEKGYAEFYKLPVGETTITLDLNTAPRDKSGDFGEQCIFRISVGKETYDFSISVKSPLYRSILETAEQGKTHMTIVRTGEGKNTRYTIKKVS